MRIPNAQSPKRGEIWLVQFAPSTGSEITNPHPAVVVSRDDVGVLPLRVVVPITSFQPRFANVPWMVTINSTSNNGLHHKSVADCFQPRSFDVGRFLKKRGELTPTQTEQIARIVAEVLGVTFEESKESTS